MSSTVWKFQVPPDGCELEMPVGATVVYVAPFMEAEDPAVTFWAEVDPAAPSAPRWFHIAGTGHPVPDNGEYRGTTQILSIGLVFHLYEVTA